MKKPVTDSKKFVPALGFHRLTPLYDWVAGCAGYGLRRWYTLTMQAQLANEQRVLDLGSGTGSLAILIKQHFPGIEISALDCDPKILSLASRKAKQAQTGIHFVRAFAERLPYPDNHFDRILSSLLFHHLTQDSKRRAAAEMLRVLKPDGQVHVMDWGRAANPVMRCLFFPVQLIDGFGNTRDNVAGRLPEFFEQAGFCEVAQQQVFNTIFGTLAFYRAAKRADSGLSLLL
ncbi:Ubiquinone/menaquinone biosynthesis C-methylase UbiE [Nitrosomonas sp. Nm51]|uniref:class I SAM-dependent methyltransferase n=1 Tax=Nitrosomonas sp. Nm51 TaxID=133720 RepID=UPI0008C190DF|nr:class I SAM-dependent methyltransferase [Nitrosomonas sp. Nm51]SER59171.1 Ubiquinone/menaquinone biosynthesis C-methylase UbiE [Nitrosomonas sp. Nm51]